MNMGLIGINQNKNVFKTDIGTLLQSCMREISVFKDLKLINMLFYGYGISNSGRDFETLFNIVCDI